VSGETSSTPPPAEGARSPRWIDSLTLLLLFAAALTVVATASPALLRAAGLAPFGPPSQSRVPFFSPPRGHSPAWSHDDAEDDRGDPDDGAGVILGPAAPDAEDDADDPGPRPRMRPAIVKKRTVLRNNSTDDADPMGELGAGDAVYVVREQGSWVLVLRSGAEGVMMGWMKKSQLTMQ